MSVASSIQVGHRLLSKHGEPVTLSYLTGRIVDEATGEITAEGTTIAIDAYGYPGRYMANEVNGGSIQSSDTRLLLENVSTRPQVGWSAEFDSKVHRVMDVRPVRKSATDIVYILSCRAQ